MDPAQPRQSRRGAERLGFLVAPAMLGAVGLASWIAIQGPRGVIWIIIGLAVSLPLLWIVTSTLWPAKANRRCPRCRGEELSRLDETTTIGLLCRACGYRDETASSWLLAEEEGALENILLEQRRRGAGKAPKQRIDMRQRSDMDSSVRAN